MIDTAGYGNSMELDSWRQDILNYIKAKVIPKYLNTYHSLVNKAQ